MSTDNTITLNFGPQHPAAHGVLRLILQIDGEVVKGANPHIGFLHRGTEKLIEHKTFLQALPYFDRLDYVAPIAQEHCFCLAIERLLKCQVPKRAQYLRVIFCEISRILNHMLNVTTHALDVGATTPLLWLFEEREKLMSFCERVCGARLHAAYIRPGGVARDIDAKFIDDLDAYLATLPAKLDDVDSLILENRIFVDRLVAVGAVSAQDALAWGFSGPMLRASGVVWDLRRNQPYEIYDELDFSIPVGENGDCYDRFRVRMLEMRESIKILQQCLKQLPAGATISDNHQIAPPAKSDIYDSMEAMINHFKLYTEGFRVPAGQTYTAVEAPKGEFAVYLVTDGSNRPYRCHIRAPSFAHLQAFNQLSVDHLLADVATNLGSIDVVFGEVDR